VFIVLLLGGLAEAVAPHGLTTGLVLIVLIFFYFLWNDNDRQ